MTATPLDQPRSPDPVPRVAPTWRRPALVAATALAAASAGYVAGAHSSQATVAVRQGTAVISPAQIGATSGGVSYSIPLDVSWKDSSGGWHEGDRPSCLPSTISTAPVTFGAVKYRLNGVGGYVVVWVDCSR